MLEELLLLDSCRVMRWRIGVSPMQADEINMLASARLQ
jgi:hypothetical protein